MSLDPIVAARVADSGVCTTEDSGPVPTGTEQQCDKAMLAEALEFADIHMAAPNGYPELIWTVRQGPESPHGIWKKNIDAERTIPCSIDVYPVFLGAKFLRFRKRFERSVQQKYSADAWDVALQTPALRIAFRGRTVEKCLMEARAGESDRRKTFVAFGPDAVARLKPRRWIYGRQLLRAKVSITAGPGGIGKSTLVMNECLALATGKSLLGDQVHRRCTVLVISGEDETDELHRSAAAAMAGHGIGWGDIGKRLILIGNDEFNCTLASSCDGGRSGRVCERSFLDLEHMVANANADVLVLDPLINFHSVNENATGAMAPVVARLRNTASGLGIAVQLVLHTRKADGQAGSPADSVRGSSALVNASRNARLLERMTRATARKLGLPHDQPLQAYFAITNAKTNVAAAAERKWMQVCGTRIPNGEEVAYVKQWIPKAVLSDLVPGTIKAIQERLLTDQDRWWRDMRSQTRWVGELVASEMGINMMGNDWRRQVERIVDGLVGKGFLKEVRCRDAQRKMRVAVQVGSQEIHDA